MTLGPVRGFLLCASPLVLAGLLLSCRTPPPPEVEYSGCWSFYSSPEPVCTLWPGDPTLKLWVRTEPGDRVEIRADGQKIKGDGEVARAGLRYELTLPTQASLLSVTVYPQAGNKDVTTWSLRLAKPDKPGWFTEIEKLADPQEARRRLESLRRSAPREEQCWVLGWLADLAETPQEAEKLLQQSAALDRTHHHWSGEAQTITRLVHLYIDHGRFRETAQALRSLKIPPKAPASNKFHIAYNLGVLAEKTGDYGEALRQLREAGDLARRVGMSPRERDANQMLALVYQELGRPDEASKVFVKLLADPNLKSSCYAGELWTNLGWFQLMQHEAGNSAENPALALQKALAEFEQNKCSQNQRLNAHLNLALAYQQQRQWSAARQELAQARTLATNPNLLELLWQDDLEARMALHEGHPELALSLYETLEKRSERAASPAGLLQALLGQANAYRASGQSRKAIDALAKADHQIDQQSRHIPVHQGLDTFFAYQEAATRLYLELLLEEGHRRSAFELARRSRSRLLRQLAVRDRLSQLNPGKRKAWFDSLSRYNALREAVERDAAKRWQLAFSEKERALEAEAEKLKNAQEDLDLALRDLDALGGSGEEMLSLPAPGEVILAYHPLPGKRWAAFAATAQGLVVATFELPEKMDVDPEQRAKLLLTPSPPFQAAIAGTTSVRVLPYGPLLRTVDFHALPFAGQTLLATHLVAYSLDLPRRSASTSRSGQNEALVVSNPTRDLRTAETEGKTVAKTIERWPGWKVTALKGSDAKSEKVSDALARVSFFHYAGHGTFGGFAGWSSELPLAAQSRLTLSDILALSHMPDWIVLSACDAGRTSEEAPGEGVGLANAFLLAGAKAVVAAREQVPDSSANELMAEMYRHWQPGEDLPHQLRRAQLACSRMNPSPCPSWASFRLLVP